MARPRGFEPLTARFVAEYSIQLSYGRAIPFSSVCRIREANYNDSKLGIQLLLIDY
jgi:hypothetical protein